MIIFFYLLILLLSEITATTVTVVDQRCSNTATGEITLEATRGIESTYTYSVCEIIINNNN